MVPTPDRLRMLRERTGLNQMQTAQKLNIPAATYSSYENGSNPKPEMLAQLAVFFGTTCDFLLGVTDEVKPVNDTVSSLFGTIAKRGNTIVSTSDVANLADTTLRYLRAGTPCGNIPLEAWHDFMQELQASLEAAIKGDCVALVDSTNAAVIAALNVTKMPAAFYEKKGGITHE